MGGNVGGVRRKLGYILLDIMGQDGIQLIQAGQDIPENCKKAKRSHDGAIFLNFEW